MRVTDRYQSTIDPSTLRGTTAAGAAGKGQKAGETSKSERNIGASAVVEVSDTAKALAAGTARVDELKAAVQKGTYKIDASAIAARLVGG